MDMRSNSSLPIVPGMESKEAAKKSRSFKRRMIGFPPRRRICSSIATPPVNAQPDMSCRARLRNVRATRAESAALRNESIAIGLRTPRFISAQYPGTFLHPRVKQDQRALLRFLLPESRLATTAIDPTGKWPDEHGFLVMGWSLRSVKALGHTFGQNAVLWVGKDAVPKLVLL
jgi:hypothetical protein